MNESIIRLPSPATVTIADRVRAMKASGRQIIALQTGDPDFCTPSSIIDVACKAMHDGFTHYGDSRGLLELREAVAEKTYTDHGVLCQPDRQILVTCGGIHAYFCALQAILNPGDEVLVPDPAWMSHKNIVALGRGVPVAVPSCADNDFYPSLCEWERAVSPRSRALIINSPNNPTGMVASEDYMRKLNEFAERHSLYVISDEVYDSILYDDRKHVCFAGLPGAQERTIIINSFSKTYAMTGWRIGYLLAPESVIDQAHKVSQHTITNVVPFIQKAARFALTDKKVQEEIVAMRKTYQRRRDSAWNVWKQFVNSPITFSLPQGAFYLWLNASLTELKSVDLAARLLSDVDVAVVPGSLYGQCGEGYLRMTIAASEDIIKTGFYRLLKWCHDHLSND